MIYSIDDLATAHCERMETLQMYLEGNNKATEPRNEIYEYAPVTYHDRLVRRRQQHDLLWEILYTRVIGCK